MNRFILHNTLIKQTRPLYANRMFQITNTTYWWRPPINPLIQAMMEQQIKPTIEPTREPTIEPTLNSFNSTIDPFKPTIPLRTAELIVLLLHCFLCFMFVYSFTLLYTSQQELTTLRTNNSKNQ